jgi:hypothetical protein
VKCYGMACHRFFDISIGIQVTDDSVDLLVQIISIGMFAA